MQKLVKLLREDELTVCGALSAGRTWPTRVGPHERKDGSQSAQGHFTALKEGSKWQKLASNSGPSYPTFLPLGFLWDYTTLNYIVKLHFVKLHCAHLLLVGLTCIFSVIF